MLYYFLIARAAPKAGVKSAIRKTAWSSVTARASAFDVLDKDAAKKRGIGAIVCLYDTKLYLADDLVVLPIEYV